MRGGAWCAIAAASGLAGLGCEHNHASGMQLSVLKRTATGCYRAIGADAPDPVLGLPACATSVDPTIAPGVDQLQFAIDYGEHVEVSRATALADPGVTVAFDGVAATAPIAFGPAHRSGGRIWFVASYDVPVVAAGTMAVSAEAAADLRDTAGPFAVALATPAVRVQDCAGAARCTLEGTGTTATVEVSVPSRTAQPVALVTRLGGIAAGDPQTVMTIAGAGASPAATGTAVLALPYVDAATGWEIEARWLGTVAVAEVSLVPPAIAVALEDCPPPAPCSATAGVGQVHAAVEIPGDTAQAAVVRSFVGGALVGEQPITTAPVATHRTRGSAALAVPFAPEGASWRVDVTWRSRTGTAAPVTLHAPVVTSAIGCGAPCAVAAGSAVELAIAAPKAIQASTASFTASTPGAPPSTSTLASSTVDESTATRVWRTTLIAPATGPWKIDASVAGYPATTINADIVP